jgi:hypothetical protein
VGDGCLPFSGVSWGTSGDILFSTGSGIVRTTSAGNRQEPITIATEQEGVLTHSYPAFLPDGQHYVFLQKGTSPDTSGIYLSRLGAATRTRLVSDLSRPVVVADSDGRIDLVFVRRGSLLVQRFDLAERRLLGEPAVLASGIRLTLTGHNGAYAASTTVLAYRSGGTVFDVSRLVWFDRGGARVGTVETNPDTSITSLSLSPDQNALLFGQYDRDANTIGIWEYNVERGIAQPVLRDPFVSFDSPDWMPARQGFVLNSNATGRWQSRVWSFDRQARQPSPLRSAEQLLDLSDDGRFLIVARASGSGNDPTPDTWVIPMEDRKPPFTVVSGSFSKGVAHLSPDGRWLAFASGESGHGSDVYLQRFPSGTRIRVSTDGGLDPQWRRDGRELYYLTSDGTLRAVEIGGGETPAIGQPRTLFRAPLGESVQPLLSRRSHFVPSADGQRFLFIVPVGTPAPVMIVTNWRSQLER